MTDAQKIALRIALGVAVAVSRKTHNKLDDLIVRFAVRVLCSKFNIDPPEIG